MKLLITTWGEPYFWKEVSYHFEDREDKNCSTLNLLKRVLKPDKVILVVNDTLVGKSKQVNPNCKKERKFNLPLEFEGKNYTDIVNFVNNYIRKTLEAFETSADYVWILPSVGYFTNAVANGELSDLRYFLFVEFFKLFDQLLDDEEVEIYLDITHGQNFLPTFTYEVLKTVLEILAFFVKEIKLTVLNSDPFIFQANPPSLEIHRVVERKIKTKPYLYYIDKFDFLTPVQKVNMAQIRKSIEEVKKRIPIKLIENIPAFLGAIYNALPLVIFYTYLNPSYVEHLIDTAMGVYRDNINVGEKDGKIFLRRSLKLRPEIEVLAIYGIFLKGMQKKFPYLDKIAYFKTQNEIKVPLEALKELAERFLSYNARNKAFLGKEIEDLKRHTEKYLKENGDFDWLGYKDVKDRQRKKEISGKNNLKSKKEILTQGNEERNFLAHAGLSENAIKIKTEKGKIFIRYTSENINIYKWARKGLEKL